MGLLGKFSWSDITCTAKHHSIKHKKSFVTYFVGVAHRVGSGMGTSINHITKHHFICINIISAIQFYIEVCQSISLFLEINTCLLYLGAFQHHAPFNPILEIMGIIHSGHCDSWHDASVFASFIMMELSFLHPVPRC